MAHRLNSVAIGACRRLVRPYPSRGGQMMMTAAVAAPPQITTPSSSRIRPHASQKRCFHLTNVARNDDGVPAAAKAAAEASATAPFASPKVETLFQKIIYLDMVEVHLLAELINEKMGITISDAERDRMAKGGGGGGGKKEEEAAPVEEKTIFDLRLTAFDAKTKIKVIKEVRSIAGLGLKEAKELVEKAPSTVRKDIKKEEAEELKAKLEALGATVEIV